MDEESNQSQQQQLLESSNSNTSSSFLYKQIKHSFWMFWTVVGAFLITSIFLSINTITHVDYVKDEEPELTPVVSTHPTASPNNSMPWLIVAAFGCAAGAIAIAKRRKNLSVLPAPQNQPPEPQVQLSTQEKISSPPQENQQIDLIESEDLLAEEKTLSILEDQLLISVQELEVEETANTETQSLADMLDIRKKLPLSAILGENYQQLEAKNE